MAPSAGSDSTGDSGGDSMPEWMSCDFAAYNLLQEVSSQIALNCESFGKQLARVCGQAIEKLPPSDGPFDSADACLSFISAFDALSHVLLQLAGDVESSVRQPLQGIIISLTEERTGRMKHWKQVRSRFAELQERYRRSRQRSIEARGRLEKNESNKGQWFRKKSDQGQVANEQHAAMCELAECEEELRESEAEIRRLEEENKEMLGQLDREKQVVLRGALAKGTGALRRLVSVADKALSPEQPDPAPASPASEGFAGVMPRASPQEDDELADDQAKGEKAEEAAVSAAPAPKAVVPGAPSPRSAEGAEAPEGGHASVDPSAKYVQSSSSKLAVDISEWSESEGEVEQDASFRAAGWSPAMAADAPVAKAAAAKRRTKSLVFQSSGGSSLISKPGTVRKKSLTADTAATPPPKDHPSVSTPLPALGRLAALRDDAADGVGREPSFSSPDAGEVPAPIAPARALPSNSREGQPSSSSTAVAPVTPKSTAAPPVAPPPVASPKASVTEEPRRPSSSAQSPEKRRPSLVDSSSDDDDEAACSSPGKKAPPKPPLEQAEVVLEVLPLVVENAQKCFERYVQRLPDALVGAAETTWEKLQDRANEQCLGGHVGKLEIFWICRPGSEPSPETADGLVCFQFVQGFAANFVRVLHLSVVSQGSAGAGEPWSGILPSAIFVVRRFIFETLPVDNIRAVVLAREDESGSIYVDGDVEAAYERCRFRWFQLTQNLRRSRSGIRRKKKLKPSTRFLVLHAPRQATDPPAPRNSSIGRLPAVLLKNNPSAGGEEASTTAQEAAEPAQGFSAW